MIQVFNLSKLEYPLVYTRDAYTRDLMISNLRNKGVKGQLWQKCGDLAQVKLTE